MVPSGTKLIFTLFLVTISSAVCFGQTDVTSRTPSDHRTDPGDLGKNVRETLAKQRAEREKKDFKELLERGDQAVRISAELERSFESTKQVTSLERDRLQTLEKLVSKIRSELGGSDDEGATDDGDEKPPADLADAFEYLKASASKLADQLKRSTRFTVSAAAIQTSNSFLRVIKFLRLRR